MPRWKPDNLRRHHQKRMRKDAGCLEDLLGTNGHPITELQYEERAERAYSDAWAEYEGEGRDYEAGKFEAGTYVPARAYFVDEQLVVAITDLWRSEFVTCYHHHFNGCKHEHDPGRTASPGQRQLRFRQDLKHGEQGGMIRNLKRLRGFKK